MVGEKNGNGAAKLRIFMMDETQAGQVIPRTALTAASLLYPVPPVEKHGEGTLLEAETVRLDLDSEREAPA